MDMLSMVVFLTSRAKAHGRVNLIATVAKAILTVEVVWFAKNAHFYSF